MAYRQSYRSPRKARKTSKWKAREKQILGFAYNSGLVARGMENRDSKITQAYNRGLKRRSYTKRTLF